jgi:hypothetical protein
VGSDLVSTGLLYWSSIHVVSKKGLKIAMLICKEGIVKWRKKWGERKVPEKKREKGCTLA